MKVAWIYECPGCNEPVAGTAGGKMHVGEHRQVYVHAKCARCECRAVVMLGVLSEDKGGVD